MEQEVVAKRVDCRNQICPKPVFMVKEALANAQLGQLLEVVVNDRVSKDNILRYCWNHGQQVSRSFEEGEDFHVMVVRSPEKKAEKPMPAVGPCGTRWD